MTALKSHLYRLGHSAVLWSWVFNVLRLASGILLLPLLLHRLSSADLGMYYVFVSLTGLVPVIDAAFSFNISRFVSYGMAGARRLQPHGMEEAQLDGRPNFELLWQLLTTSRAMYRFLSAGVVLILGTGGTAMVAIRITETSNPVQTWTAWGVTVGAAAWEVYSGWWNAYLRGMNQVAASSRISSLAYALRLVLAGLLLISGAGLLALPAAGLVTGFIQRHLARRHCLHLMSSWPAAAPLAPTTGLVRILWPNSWRTGLKLASLFLGNVTLAMLSLNFLGLGATAQYGLSLQILTAVHAVAGVWTAVKWPLVSQQRARNDLAAVRQTLWPRFWLQNLTFITAAAITAGLGPWLLVLIGTDKRLIPTLWLLVMAANTFLEMQFAFWSTLVSTENRLPSLWPTVISSAVTMLSAAISFYRGWAGFAPLVMIPLIVGCLCNYWYWGYVGARQIGTTWRHFVFTRPVCAVREEKVGLA